MRKITMVLKCCFSLEPVCNNIEIFAFHLIRELGCLFIAKDYIIGVNISFGN